MRPKGTYLMLLDRKGTTKVFTLTVRLRFRPVGLTSSRPSFAQNKQRAESTELVVSCRSFTARPNFAPKLSEHGVFSPLTIVNNVELMIETTCGPTFHVKKELILGSNWDIILGKLGYFAHIP
jgi:hypothetical protein